MDMKVRVATIGYVWGGFNHKLQVRSRSQSEE